jgi:enoyl-CoA hydratase
MAKVIYEKRDQIAYITLNRPEVHNAIDTETDELLFEAWTNFRDDRDVRIAILTGAGDKTFCAGADLKSHVDPWLNAGPELGRSLLEKGFAGRITRGLHRMPKPIIAALNGWVIGGGIELALACDIRIASEKAQFGSFELRRGMHPADGGIVRLVNICGAGIALEMELTGEPIDAQRALQCNMVARVVPHDELMSTVDSVVASILRNDRQAVESAKETILEVIGKPLDDQLRVEGWNSYSVLDRAEAEELLRRFFAGEG